MIRRVLVRSLILFVATLAIGVALIAAFAAPKPTERGAFQACRDAVLARHAGTFAPLTDARFVVDGPRYGVVAWLDDAQGRHVFACDTEWRGDAFAVAHVERVPR